MSNGFEFTIQSKQGYYLFYAQITTIPLTFYLRIAFYEIDGMNKRDGRVFDTMSKTENCTQKPVC